MSALLLPSPTYHNTTLYPGPAVGAPLHVSRVEFTCIFVHICKRNCTISTIQEPSLMLKDEVNYIFLHLRMLRPLALSLCMYVSVILIIF